MDRLLPGESVGDVFLLTCHHKEDCSYLNSDFGQWHRVKTDDNLLCYIRLSVRPYSEGEGLSYCSLILWHVLLHAHKIVDAVGSSGLV